MKDIIFLGGIHGVGKGKLCKHICKELDFHHLSASEVLKWNEISEPENKLVNDFNLTQNRLISNLALITVEDQRYVLDGHYCLLNSNHEPEQIDFETFRLLDPLAFVVVTDDAEQIKVRLEGRDKKEYDLELLQKFQEMEIKYAMELARKLSKPFLILTKDDYHKFKLFLSNENIT